MTDTTAIESVIDSIPHPELRDRLILLRGLSKPVIFCPDAYELTSARFDLVDALHDYAKNLTLHGDDVLAHNNWEISESWIRQYQCVSQLKCTLEYLAELPYSFLVDQSLLNISNRWRRERGEAELTMADINPPEVQGTV